MSKPNLLVIIASVRQGRVGLPVAEWIIETARELDEFDVEVADLAEINLPMMDEPNHPRLRKYTHQHTWDWSARIEAAEAFIFVMPEYNYGFNAPLKNAIDYLHNEWKWKPVAFVSYGGVSAGTRAVQMIKQVVTTLNMFALNEAVSIPFVQQFLDEDGRIQPNETMEAAARTMLHELYRVALAMQTLRQREAVPA
jgi:NAD(P)H-dependent FMN reductase